LASGRAIQTFEAGPARVDALAFSANGRKLAAGGATKAGSGLVTVWDAETRAVLGTTDRVGLVKFLAFHPDGARLAVADIGAAKLHLWDLVTGTLITNPTPRGVSCVTFTPDQKRLAVLGYDGNVHLCDARTGDEVLVLRGFGPPPGTMGFTPRMAFSPDGSRIAAHYGLGPMLNIWDVGPGSGLAAEPQAHNLAGWLRKSRALADRGDGPGAEVAYRHARELDGRDPSPWIEHAVSLWRHGDSPQAGDALARALVSLPDDLGRYSDLGRLLERFGRTSESETVLAKARSLLERRLSHTPDDEETAAILADLLPDTGAGGGWTVLQPDAPTSAGGATLTRLPDGSVLAGGLSPAADTYTVEAVTSLAGITGLRLEVLPDASLPAHGPGRGPKNGNFALDTIRLSADLEPRGPARYRVPLTRARADYSSLVEGVRGVIGAIDEDSGTCWTIWPRTGRAHRAVFQTAEPLGAIAGTRLRVELTFRSRWLQHALGRFRLSVTNRPLPLFETSLTKIKADEERNGLTRLGAAYYLEDKWASAADVLERAAARPEARALDRFLLALAHHHIGRPDVARADCDHALKRLRNDRADDETRDVAAEALVTIRGLSIGEAESLVLDVVFPANAFAP